MNLTWLAISLVMIIDEAHERTSLGHPVWFGERYCHILKDLKVLISSATLDADKFS